MGIKRIVDTSFWTDGKVDDFSPEDKYFMLYLMTNPFTTQLGIYEISIKQAAFQLGYSMDAVKVLLDRFESKYGIIVYSPYTNEIAIKNYLYHSIVKGGKPVEDCIMREMKLVKNKNLIRIVFEHISQKSGLNQTIIKIINQYFIENEIDNEKENDNENENDVSYHDSYNDSYHDSLKPKKVKPTKHKYGEYKNVLLSDEELDKLQNEYPDWQERIERLSSYVASTGKSYKSHYATIRNWARKDATQPTRNNFVKQSKADELDDFYRMAKEWSESE